MTLALLREQRPDWWVLGISGAAWVGVLAHALGPSALDCHARSFVEEWGAWLLMVAAMMLPATLEPVRWCARRSFHARRTRTIAFFVAGFFAVWALAGLGVAATRPASPAFTAALFAGAALWMMSPMWLALRSRCHAPAPLAPSGWRADRDALRYGAAIGVPCLASCAPLMVACAWSGHGLVAMVGGGVVGMLERSSYRIPRTALVTTTLALAGWYAGAALA